MSLVLIMFGIFFLCAILGMPVAISAGIASIVGLLIQGESLQGMVQLVYTSVDSYPLIAVPCFILAGTLMDRGGLAVRLTNLANSMVGSMYGGLAWVAIIACAFFAALTGSGPATTAAIGSIMVPAMKKENYDPAYAGAVVACSGGLGVIIPPSIPLIIYGVIGEVSITQLFLAGFIPGILLAFLLGGANYFHARTLKYRSTGREIKLKNILKSVEEAKWALLAPVIILGGIYSGVFTPTEASIVAINYSLLVGFLIYRHLKLKDVLESLMLTAKLTGIAFILLFNTIMFGEILTVNQIPQKLAQALLSLTDSWILVLLLIDVFLLFLGMFVGVIAMLVLLVPILLPIIQEFGISP
ncbi:MAG: TRAP transporter large permease, partial [Deltaproteobacteria bacterium]|nr:TRAP transporter large permease [Deltaproteobacteria bacterium]